MAADDFEAQVAKLIAGQGIDIDPDGNRYLALYEEDPTDDPASSTEIAGGSYARKQIVFNAPSGGVITNDGQIDYLDMPACTVTHWVVWDHITATTMAIQTGEFTDPETVIEGGTFTVDDTGLEIQVE